MKAKTTFSLKDQLFNPEKVHWLAQQFVAAHPDFAAATFEQETVTAFPDLELKQRISHITERLHAHLPAAYPEALAVILRALPPELDPTKTDDDFGDFIIAPLSNFVAMYGCEAQYLAISLNGLREITKRFSAEDSIRFFLNNFPTETLTFLTDCAQSDNYHVRRLASEGTRPKLPWAQKLTIDYHDPLPLLDTLFSDPTRYVTRSVANHLNDLAKIDPPLVIEILARWQASERQDAREMAWLTTHALRTLVKKGDTDALTLLGFGETPDITIKNLQTTTPTVPLGEKFQFRFDLVAHKKQNLLVDYWMTFAGKDGKTTRKVFKLKQLAVQPGQTVNLRKKHLLKLMTTRQLYPGTHTITLQVNGQEFDSLAFELLFP